MSLDLNNIDQDMDHNKDNKEIEQIKKIQLENNINQQDSSITIIQTNQPLSKENMESPNPSPQNLTISLSQHPIIQNQISNPSLPLSSQSHLDSESKLESESESTLPSTASLPKMFDLMPTNFLK